MLKNYVSLNTAFLDVLPSNTETVTVQLGTKPVNFKLDTGAAVTAISESEFNTLPFEKLQKPCRQKLDVLGQYTAVLSHQNAAPNKKLLYTVKNGVLLQHLGC